MAAHTECRTEDIEATAQQCFDALTDFERLPEWQRAVRAVRVLERDKVGRGSIVDYEVDAHVKTVRYRLRQIYDEPHRLASEYLGGDFRDFCGEWRFLPSPSGGTHVELDLRIDAGPFIPARIRTAIADAVMGRALRDLKRHVERRA